MQDPFKDLQKDVAAFLRDAAPDVDDPPRRKRGAQPGNQNARKHFFYAPGLEADEADALEHAMELRDFSQELALLRVKLLALLHNPNPNPDHFIKLLNSLSKAMQIQMKCRFGK